MEKNYNLHPLWDAILDIYQAFAKVCDKHGLRYYATGGTALGAMRHKGFIPWDDDFDLVMPRPDYTAFMAKYYKELPTWLNTINFINTPEFDYEHGKIKECRKEIIDKIISESRLSLNEGVFIDIIPIDGLPKADIQFKIWAFKRRIWRKNIYINKLCLTQKLLWRTLGFLMLIPFDKIKIRKQYEKWLSSINFDSARAVDDVNTNSKRLLSRNLTKETFGEGKMVPFYTSYVRVPTNVEYFLEEIFGDWKKLPPVEQRIPSHQII